MTKRNMKLVVSVFAAVFAVSSYAASTSGGAREKNKNNPLNAVVKLEVFTSKANIARPWINMNDSSKGSGVVIGDGRILTCAHCVSDSSYIRVRKHNEDTLYYAKNIFVDNDADLALVQVEDPKFMADITPMEIGETPRVQDEVLAVGFPMGGDDISFTRGIVSRIEDICYSHGWTILLGVQVDAAINPGNSGGPVLDLKSGKIVGIAFQGKDKEKSELLGYIVPPDIIRHFLKDIEDGRVDGFSDILFSPGNMESPDKRKYYRMQSSQTGMVVHHVDAALGKNSIKQDDVILEIDGYKVSNNGRIRLDGGEPRSIFYPIYTRQIGEKIPVKVLRNGAVVETCVTAAKKKQLIRGWMHGRRPDYFLYGGFVFTTVSYDYIVRSRTEFHDNIFKDKEHPDDEPVAISYCFSDVGIEGYNGSDNVLVRKVNGEKVRNLKHLAKILDDCKDGFVSIEVDKNTEWSLKLVVDALKMRETTERVMKRNQIPFDRSEDLRRNGND